MVWLQKVFEIFLAIILKRFISVQINEVSSSDTETDKTPSEKVRPQGSPKLQAGRKSLSRELANLNLESPLASTTTNSRQSRRSTTLAASTTVKTAEKEKLQRKGRRSIEGLGHEDSDTENDDKIGGNGGRHVATGSLDEEMVPASRLAEVEKKCEALTQKLKVRFMFYKHFKTILLNRHFCTL